MTTKIGGIPSLSDNVNVKAEKNVQQDDGQEPKLTQPIAQKQEQREWQSNDTFFVCYNEEKKTGFELDLISQREKGKEERFLKIEVQGFDRDGNIGRVFILLDKQSNFDAFKDFVSKLNWNS